MGCRRAAFLSLNRRTGRSGDLQGLCQSHAIADFPRLVGVGGRCRVWSGCSPCSRRAVSNVTSCSKVAHPFAAAAMTGVCPLVELPLCRGFAVF